MKLTKQEYQVIEHKIYGLTRELFFRYPNPIGDKYSDWWKVYRAILTDTIRVIKQTRYDDTTYFGFVKTIQSFNWLIFPMITEDIVESMAIGHLCFMMMREGPIIDDVVLSVIKDKQKHTRLTALITKMVDVDCGIDNTYKVHKVSVGITTGMFRKAYELLCTERYELNAPVAMAA